MRKLYKTAYHTNPMLAENKITLASLYKILFEEEPLTLSDQCMQNWKRVSISENISPTTRSSMGINTGLLDRWPNTVLKMNPLSQLQYNIIRSHATGAGHPLPELYVKAAMIARLYTFLQGKSGIHKRTGIAHYRVYQPGDYSIRTRTRQCRGQWRFGTACPYRPHPDWRRRGLLPRQEKRYGIRLAENGLQPFKMHIREGLSVTNGTSVMTGIGIVNLIYARQLMHWAVGASVMMNEIAASYDDFMSEPLNEAKRHEGQQEIARMMRQWVEGSQCVRKRENELYNGKHEEKIFTHKVQPYYSLRCIPQILGPVYDELLNAEKVLINENKIQPVTTR